MTRVLRTESYRRGIIGWIVKLLFIAFNLLMASWIIIFYWQWAQITGPISSEAERAGAAIGAAIGTGAILFFWTAGAVILGLLTYFTRGERVVTERHINGFAEIDRKSFAHGSLKWAFLILFAAAASFGYITLGKKSRGRCTKRISAITSNAIS